MLTPQPIVSVQLTGTPVAAQHDCEAHKDAGFHDHTFDVANATPGYRETGSREKSVQSFAIKMSEALPAPDRNRLDEGVGHPATQDEAMPNGEAAQKSRCQTQELKEKILLLKGGLETLGRCLLAMIRERRRGVGLGVEESVTEASTQSIAE